MQICFLFDFMLLWSSLGSEQWVGPQELWRLFQPELFLFCDCCPFMLQRHMETPKEEQDCSQTMPRWHVLRERTYLLLRPPDGFRKFSMFWINPQHLAFICQRVWIRIWPSRTALKWNRADACKDQTLQQKSWLTVTGWSLQPPSAHKNCGSAL